MAALWTVLVFGDSWADYMHPTWPQVLGRRLSAQVLNFAQAGSMCGDLAAQAQRALLSPQVPKAAGGLLRPETLVVVHTCGNDFIMKMAEALMGGGGLGGLLGGGLVQASAARGMGAPEILRPNPGGREAEILHQFLQSMHRGGARNFLVSGVPAFIQMPVFNLVWPIIGGMVNAGKLEDLGVSPGDPPQLAMEVQVAALHERWSEMVARFGREHPDSTCVFFDEVGALERLRETLGPATFDRSMWDFSMFHPSVFGHEQIAFEAHRCTAQGFPALAALAPHPEVPSEASRLAREEAERKAKAAAEQKARAEAEQRAREEAQRRASEAAQCQDPRPMTVKVRNVKGDVSFAVTCDAGWTAPRLREAVVAAAPAGFVPAGRSCVLALKGKFLGEGPETLADLGVAEDANLVVVVRAPTTAAAAAATNGAA